MDVFISYSSKYRDLAERLELALEAEGHSTFVDRSELEPGQPFDEELRKAVAECDVFIFLVSPESVASGSYTLAELGLAQQRWRHPGGRVLPVVVAPTPIVSVPPYLKAVTLLEPRGEVVAETLAAVARLRGGARRWPLIAAAIAMVVVAGAATGYWMQRQAAERAQVAREVASAADVCNSGGFAAAWNRFEELANRYPSNEPLQLARESCGMKWLREIRVRVGEQTFGDIVKRVQPVLVAGLSTSKGQRAADLYAHLGWADYLLNRDGVREGDPATHFRRAFEDEPENVYAHAMLARHLWWSRNGDADARAHFKRAVASGRDREFVRALQFGGSLSRAELFPYALIVANDMRTGGEKLTDPIRRQLWRSAYWSGVFASDNRAEFFAILSPNDHLATFEWLVPRDSLREDEQSVWKYVHAILLSNAGKAEQARDEMQSLLSELEARKSDGRLIEQTRKALAAWSPQPAPTPRSRR